MTYNQNLKKNSPDYSEKTNSELISIFNDEVEKKGWSSSRALLMVSIHNEFEKRNFDYSEIGNESSLSFKSKIRLSNKKITYLKDA